MRFAVFVLTLAVMACESDADKLQRLSGEQTIACLAAQGSKIRNDSLISTGKERGDTAMVSRGVRAQAINDAQCDLATRAYNKFMH